MNTRWAPIAVLAAVLVIAVAASSRDGGGAAEPDLDPAAGQSAHVTPATAEQAAPPDPDAAPTPPPSPQRPSIAGEADLDEAMPEPTEAPAVWDDLASASATASAAAALEAFARPGSDVDDATWWQALEPTLSTAAAPIYARVDPRLVPYTRLLQVQPAQRAGSDLLAAVTATTDAGPYDVLLSREDGNSPWLVERLRPQERP